MSMQKGVERWLEKTKLHDTCTPRGEVNSIEGVMRRHMVGPFKQLALIKVTYS
jgi:hypothetical protein